MQKNREIVRDEDIMGGEPHIEDTRITVLQIVNLVEERGLSAQMVADKYDQDVADIYRSLTYYHENPSVIAEVRKRRQNAEKQAFENDGAVKLSELTE